MEITYEKVEDPLDPEGIKNLAAFFDILLQINRRDKERQKRLKLETGGFALESDGYSCMVCRRQMKAEESWYDWYGQTCLICRRAIKENIIPPFICKKGDSYFTMWHLKDKFNIAHQTAKKLIREEKLVSRIIIGNTGRPHEYIFLRKENPGLIDREIPEMKSYRRHRDKVLDKRIWKEKQKTPTNGSSLSE